MNIISYKKIKNYMQPIASKYLWNVINYIDRKKLKNEGFTILCPNCIGGVLYHRLNQKFNSPFINMWLEDSDLINFALNIEYYLQQNLKFIESKYSYPVALLGDIKLYFNHSTTIEEAKEQWEKRINRVNKENLFLILSDRCGLTKENIEKIEKISCKGKVIFTSNILREESYMLYLPYYKKEPYVGIYMDEFSKSFWKIAPFDEAFDYVKFFNTGEICKKRNLRMKILQRLNKKN